MSRSSTTRFHGPSREREKEREKEQGGVPTPPVRSKETGQIEGEEEREREGRAERREEKGR